MTEPYNSQHDSQLNAIGVKNSSLAQEICQTPINKRKHLKTGKKKSRFVRTCNLLATRCPLSPASPPGIGKTKFSSVETFFKMCCLKQEEVAFWGSTCQKGVLKHPKCKSCKQGLASKRGRIVVVLNELGIEIDEGMSKMIAKDCV